MPPKCGRPTDPYWAYGEQLAANRIKCSFCGKKVSSITNFKHHLAATNLHVQPCSIVPPSIATIIRCSIQVTVISAQPTSSAISPADKLKSYN